MLGRHKKKLREMGENMRKLIEIRHVWMICDQFRDDFPPNLELEKLFLEAPSTGELRRGLAAARDLTGAAEGRSKGRADVGREAS